MKLLPASVGRTMATQLLKVRKNSPGLMFAAGVAGVVTSTVLACRATLKLNETLDEFRENLEAVKSVESAVADPSKDYSKEQHQRNQVYVYTHGTVKLIKLYGPAVIVGAASLAALLASHRTLTQRNASLTAAYSALQMSYDAYRDRVKKEVGPDKELDLFHGVEMAERTINGKVQKGKVVGSANGSPYSFIFDEGNPNYEKAPEVNRMFLMANQTYFNHILHRRGHVFLNEVLDRLGFDHTPAGAVVGWVLGNGDEYVDFGLFEVNNKAFMDGWERSVILNFNCDGTIWDKI